MEEKFMSKENCLKVLENCLKSTNFELESFKVLPFHKKYEGLIGEHFTVQINYTRENTKFSKDFFLKTLSSNEVMSEISLSTNVFGKEQFFYTHIVKELEKYSIETSFSPEGYLFVPHKVVLEDLTPAGYTGSKKRQALDLAHCKICLETLAAFHGGIIAYEKKKSLELGKKFSLFDEFPDLLEDKFTGASDNGATRYLKCSINGLFQLIDIIPENHITRDEFKTKLAEVFEEISSAETPEELVSTVLHADLWSGNFLYIYDNDNKDKPLKAKLLDYQTIRYGPVQQDVMQFIMTNTRKDFRDKNYSALIEHYYKSLCELLIKAGLEPDQILPRDEFFGACEIFKLPAKVHAIVDHSVTFMSDETYNAALKSEETLRKFFFEERGKYIIDCFNQDEEFKSILLEDVLELRALLFGDV